MVKVAIMVLPTDSFSTGLSCGSRTFPRRYNASVPKTAIQIEMNTSRSSKCHCMVVSAVDKNLNANAISRKPRNTFTTFSHPPELGMEFSQEGNNANNMNGSASANPNANIPTINAESPPVDEIPTNRLPKIGPVQENEASDNTNAIKKIPTIPPLSAFSSALLVHFEGN
ncbi:hypothetical protein D3C86_1329040 [compost metagenome]